MQQVRRATPAETALQATRREDLGVDNADERAQAMRAILGDAFGDDWHAADGFADAEMLGLEVDVRAQRVRISIGVSGTSGSTAKGSSVETFIARFRLEEVEHFSLGSDDGEVEPGYAEPDFPVDPLIDGLSLTRAGAGVHLIIFGTADWSLRVVAASVHYERVDG
jgi:hypothetical protein